jgi:hypothetical protein
MMRLIVAMAALIGLSGCATVFQGGYQQFTVHTVDDKMPRATQCSIANEEGEWKALANITTLIHRDGNEMDIKCENDEQVGTSTIKPRFQGLWLVLDIVWDYCILTASCIIDGATNSFYEYPNAGSVEMKSKVAKNENKSSPAESSTAQPVLAPEKQGIKQENTKPL